MKKKKNKVIVYLMAINKIDFNLLWELTDRGFFTKKELKEFYELIGYSKEGIEELFYSDF